MAFISLFSCSKNSDDSKQEELVVESKIDAMVYIAVTAQQMSFFDQSYEFKVNGTSVEFALPKMTAIDTSAAPREFKSKLNNAIYFLDGDNGSFKDYKVYSYKLGTLSSGQKVEGVRKTWTVKSERPQQDTVNVLSACYVGCKDGEAHSNWTTYCSASTYESIKADEASLTGFAGLMSKSISNVEVTFQ